MYACAKVIILLEKLQNINSKANDGPTAISNAILCGFVEIVNLLLSYGADIESIDSYGNSPLTQSIINDGAHYEIVKLLIFSGAYIESNYPEKRTPLFIARVTHCYRVYDLFKKNGLKIRNKK